MLDLPSLPLCIYVSSLSALHTFKSHGHNQSHITLCNLYPLTPVCCPLCHTPQGRLLTNTRADIVTANTTKAIMLYWFYALFLFFSHQYWCDVLILADLYIQLLSLYEMEPAPPPLTSLLMMNMQVTAKNPSVSKTGITTSRNQQNWSECVSAWNWEPLTFPCDSTGRR